MSKFNNPTQLFEGTPETNYPAYIMKGHQNILEFLHGAWDSAADEYSHTGLLAVSLSKPNPYLEVGEVDPLPVLQPGQEALSRFGRSVGQLHPDGTWSTAVQTAEAAVSRITPGARQLSQSVASYQEKMLPGLMQSIGRFAGGMAELNATMGSSYMLGVAMLERGFQSDAGDYLTKVQLQNQREISALVLQGAQSIVDMHYRNLEARRSFAAMQGDFDKVSLIAQREHKQDRLTHEVEGALWDFQLIQASANMIGAIGGTAMVPKAPNPMSSALSGAFTGAASITPLAISTGNVGMAAAILAGGAALGGTAGFLEAV